MLKGINPLLSPELLKVLCEMGHGDEIVLAERELLALGDEDHLPYEIEPAHELGDGVLDLEARIRLHEIEAAGRIHQELERARVRVLDGLGRIDHRAAHLAANLFAKDR